MNTVTNEICHLDIFDRQNKASGVSLDLPFIHKETFTVISRKREINTEYEIILMRFSGSWQLFLTYSNNLSTWLCASADSSNADIYSVGVLLGDRAQEHYPVYGKNFIKILVECLENTGNFDRYTPQGGLTLVMALNVEDKDPETFKQIMEKITNIFTKIT